MKEEACHRFVLIVSNILNILIQPSMSPTKPKLEMDVSVPTIRASRRGVKIKKESPKNATIGNLDSVSDVSTSLGETDSGHVGQRHEHFATPDFQVCSLQLETRIL